MLGCGALSAMESAVIRLWFLTALAAGIFGFVTMQDPALAQPSMNRNTLEGRLNSTQPFKQDWARPAPQTLELRREDRRCAAPTQGALCLDRLDERGQRR